MSKHTTNVWHNFSVFTLVGVSCEFSLCDKKISMFRKNYVILDTVKTDLKSHGINAGIQYGSFYFLKNDRLQMKLHFKHELDEAVVQCQRKEEVTLCRAVGWSHCVSVGVNDRCVFKNTWVDTS